MGNLLHIKNFKSQDLRLQIGRGESKPRRGPDNSEIGALVFRCETTHRDIESGIEMDRRTYARVAALTARMYCPACRHLHEFKVANGGFVPVGRHQPRDSDIKLGFAPPDQGAGTSP